MNDIDDKHGSNFSQIQHFVFPIEWKLPNIFTKALCLLLPVRYFSTVPYPPRKPLFIYMTLISTKIQNTLTFQTLLLIQPGKQAVYFIFNNNGCYYSKIKSWPDVIIITSPLNWLTIIFFPFILECFFLSGSFYILLWIEMRDRLSKS
jgi:hypothetical protein